MHPVAKDEVITYDDVVLPEGRLADRLRAEQYRHFRGETWLEEDPLATGGAPWWPDLLAPWKSLRVPCVDAGGANTCVRTGVGPWETRGPSAIRPVLLKPYVGLARAGLLRTDDFPGRLGFPGKAAPVAERVPCAATQTDAPCLSCPD